MKKHMKTYNLPPFLLSIFSSKLLYSPDIETASAVIALTLLTGVCEYLKFKNSTGLKENQLSEINTQLVNLQNKYQDLTTQMASVKMAKGFQRVR